MRPPPQGYKIVKKSWWSHVWVSEESLICLIQASFESHMLLINHRENLFVPQVKPRWYRFYRLSLVSVLGGQTNVCSCLSRKRMAIVDRLEKLLRFFLFGYTKTLENYAPSHFITSTMSAPCLHTWSSILRGWRVCAERADTLCLGGA